jgi:hypothetical protein
LIEVLQSCHCLPDSEDEELRLDLDALPPAVLQKLAVRPAHLKSVWRDRFRIIGTHWHLVSCTKRSRMLYAFVPALKSHPLQHPKANMDAASRSCIAPPGTQRFEEV